MAQEWTGPDNSVLSQICDQIYLVADFTEIQAPRYIALSLIRSEIGSLELFYDSYWSQKVKHSSKTF